MNNRRAMERWILPRECCDAAWEEAYARFETPAEETAKFARRLRRFGVETWPRDARVVELFCGRGGGLEAWSQLGFGNLAGVDASETLLTRYTGNARLHVGDCRCLQFPDASCDVMCVQGGLHHLPLLPDDLRATIAEVRRVLRPGGRLLVVEPWTTPFLQVVHWLSRRRAVRRVSTKFDALAGMIERESDTYFEWLSRPGEIWAELTHGFDTEFKRVGWGKLSWLGRKRDG